MFAECYMYSCIKRVNIIKVQSQWQTYLVYQQSVGLQVQSVISAELNSTTAEMFDIALTIAQYQGRIQKLCTRAKKKK